MYQVVTSKRKARGVRNAYHHGNLRLEAIAAALALIRADDGPFSLRDVASAIGVSHGALYRHFKDRDALLAAVATQGFVALREAHRSARAATENDAEAKLIAICRIPHDVQRLSQRGGA